MSGTDRTAPKPFLAMPPFPRRKLHGFARAATAAPAIGDDEADALAASIAQARVGGGFWAAQPALGEGPYVLVRGDRSRHDAEDGRRTLVWDEASTSRAGLIGGVCDPWHMLSGATELRCSPDDPLRLIAGIAGVPVRVPDESTRKLSPEEVRALLREALGPHFYLDPFTGDPMPWAAVVELCAEWRRLIDSNRAITAIYGFAGWKRATTEPLLWDGSAARRFDRDAAAVRAGEKVAIWRSRTAPRQLAALERSGASLVEVEDGFLRSVGLGADCVPPQSIVVDDLGAYFDARSASRLEQLLQEEEFPPALVARAGALRSRIVALGLSKYGSGQERLARRSAKLHVLVPGQVEDDRAVLCTPGTPLTNHELLRQVRAHRPDAYIIYKPHPDIEAGHRKGAVPDALALELADEVVRAPSISSWIDLVDEVHVNSSLAGFEALLRHKRVTTYGVPFYAGWGLTEDLGPVPYRRSNRRSLDDLVAATLIVYPRSVDPVTNLPCPPEVLVARLSTPEVAKGRKLSPIVLARRLQGRLMRLLLLRR